MIGAVMGAVSRRVWIWLGVIGGGVMLVLAVLDLRRRLSKARADVRRAERRVATMREAEEIEDEVDALSRDDLDRRLGRWMRPGP